ncbi:TrbI/VirB10 family protein [Vibrio parahaemolyticus]|uniref:TrbI/VirB10 family protein n=1 Tax=Vibrio harveyi group TaxID=717610 RepID=UPI00041EAF87|nr:TrbI/VirB10 family protein [Vibrio parahaemolyticus]EGQ7678700.1 TrbI/VirB10 family protein [Vibrio parahaemolyticus]EGQ7795982.1 TrbI/VirB10 family protein [Vibrio parahaemolyticus]EGQ7810786.1 TrbI/VirB10 family protein [Vibrio parahaemolyticus]EHK0753263.1 TrbI/VirB10 family protein [Vibrio parahaemolyticus]EHR5322058.1 TrbI/VirB10 family protein [Vibrio parahaemolyticus]
MSNFTLKLNPLSGVESVHIKKGVKWTVIGLGVLMTIIVVGVIMQKGQRNKDKVSAPTPTEINTSMTTKQAALDSVLAQKPNTPAPKAVVPTPIPTGNVTPSVPTVTPEMAAQQKQRIAQLEAKQKLLNEAIYSDMNVRIDEASLRSSSSSEQSDSDELRDAEQRLAQAKAALSNPPLSVDEPNESAVTSLNASALDTTGANQASKEAFLAKVNQAGYLNARRELPASEYELTVGTLIPATLISAMNSDIPGNVIAQVSQNVYDSATGAAILIPQGTQLYGTYDARVAYGQRRLPVTWSRVNFPDGSKLNIGNMASMDVTGMNGLTGDINNHYWRLFGQATLLGGISGISQAAVSDGNDDSRSTGESVADGVTQQYAETGNMLIRKNMNIQPTIEIDNAEQFYIMVSQDVILPPYSSIR